MSKSSAEKGVLYLTISKIYFLIAGYCILFSLTRILGPEGYGVYSSINAFLAVLDAVILIGTIQAVSKFVSEDETQAEIVKQKALFLQIFVGGGIALVYFLMAPYIADFLQDNTLVPFLRLSSVIVLCYSFYGIYLGYINGRKFFVKQAIIDMTFTTLKASLLIGLAYAGLKYTQKLLGENITSIDLPVFGALGGFGLAALLVVVISIIVVKSKANVKGDFPISKLLVFQGTIIFFTLIINMLLQADLVLVKKFTDNFSTGIYSAALQLARIPYQAITAVTFVIFPLISESTFSQDTERTKMYIHNTLRFSLMLISILVVLFGSTAKGTLLFLYTDKYLPGTEILSIYVFAVMFFALFFIMTTIISGSGKPIISCIIGFITLVFTVCFNYYAIPNYGIAGAAISTTIAMFLGMLICSGYILKTFNSLIKPANAIRIILAATIIYAIGIFYNAEGHLWVAIKFILLWNAYLVLLFVFKEFTNDDIDRVKKLIPFVNKL
ncbi:MAG: oligosaccharide flippase family protein [Cyanobacteriota bacterium]